MSVIRWTKPAIQHLVEIREYIAKDSPAAGSRVTSTIREQVKALAHHPEIGRRGLLEGTRELVISRLPYLVVYQVEGDAVTVLAVVHTAKNWPATLAP